MEVIRELLRYSICCLYMTFCHKIIHVIYIILVSVVACVSFLLMLLWYLLLPDKMFMQGLKTAILHFTILFLDSVKDILRKKLMMPRILFLTVYTKIIVEFSSRCNTILDQRYVNPRNICQIIFSSFYVSF